MAYSQEQATRVINEIVDELGADFVRAELYKRSESVTDSCGRIVSDEDIQEIIRVAHHNHTKAGDKDLRVATVKAVRGVLLLGLKESVDFVDSNKALFGLK